ncbi:LytR C-terminal domain-containing protein [Gordonia sp. (in: high G+C Gram-positive bacteria)]|uniref:LytR C-terminal domain-containing protein n=1 Tax=Gordonia sp. (in: high G+C Gram-positive bacteria) TaxID=84139 RepID=UPI0039E44E6B
MTNPNQPGPNQPYYPPPGYDAPQGYDGPPAYDAPHAYDAAPPYDPPPAMGHDTTPLPRKGRRNGLAMGGVVLLVLLLLAGIGTAGWLLFGHRSTSKEAAPSSSAPPSSAAPAKIGVPVCVLNAGGNMGASLKVRHQLEGAGYRVTATGNLATRSITETTVMYSVGHVRQARAIGRLLKADVAHKPRTLRASCHTRIIIIVP